MRADIWCDGAARKHPNPGPAGAGFIVIVEGKQPVARSVPLGKVSHNVAEYQAVIQALRAAASRGADTVYLRTDSPVVVGHYRRPETCRLPHMRELLAEVKKQAARFPGGVRLWRVPRERNAVADRLAQIGRDTLP
jgi:ribonuclease HI